MLQGLRALVLLAAGALAAQSPAPGALDAVLQQAVAQRAAYVATFRNVTATETRVTEVFDDRGRAEKQRTLVSNFLVYQSRFDPAVLSEYRIPLTVDGKPAKKGAKMPGLPVNITCTKGLRHDPGTTRTGRPHQGKRIQGIF